MTQESESSGYSTAPAFGRKSSGRAGSGRKEAQAAGGSGKRNAVYLLCGWRTDRRSRPQDLDEGVVDGQLKTVLAIPEDDHNWNRTLTILAKDPAGNETRKEISFQNGALLQKITEKLQYVELYADGRAIKDGIIDLTKENSVSLKLMGILSDGTSCWI